MASIFPSVTAIRRVRVLTVKPSKSTVVSQSVLFGGPGQVWRLPLSRSEQTDMVGAKGGRGYECRLIGWVGLYACHDEVIDIYGGKEGFMGSTPANIVVFDSDTGWDLCRPVLFLGFGNVHVRHHSLPFGQDLSAVSTVVFRWECAAASDMTLQ